MNDTFLMASTSSITVQSLGKIVQRAPALGAKMWCLSLTMFVFFLSHAPSPEHRAFEGCIVRTSIALPFIGQFRRGLQRFFFTSDCSFRCRTQFPHSSLGGATICAKLRSKIAQSPKIGGKVCAHHFVQIAERFEENSTAVVQGKYVDVHLYKKILRTSLQPTQR